jgi:translation initiation factor IF-3
MINRDVSPPVCKVMNYSQELGSRFMKDVVVDE